MRLFNLFGALFKPQANGVDMSDVFMNVGRSAPTTSGGNHAHSTSNTSSQKADDAEDDGFFVCTRAESRNSVHPNLVDMANEVLFLYPLYTDKKDIAFSLVMSHPTAMWRLVKWALAGYKTTFVRVATRADAIAELQSIEVGRLRHLVVGGHGNALHRFINLGKEYLTTTDELYSDSVDDYQAKNKAAYEETVKLFTEATKRMGDASTAPHTSILLDSCQTAKKIQLEDSGEITSFFDDVVGIVQSQAQKGQKIKIVGATESFNNAQLSMCLEPASKGFGDVWCASIAKEWSFLLFSGAADVTKRVIVEP